MLIAKGAWNTIHWPKLSYELILSVLRSIDEAAGFVHTGEAQAEIRNGYRVDYATGTVTRTSDLVHKLCKCQEPKLDLGID